MEGPLEPTESAPPNVAELSEEPYERFFSVCFSVSYIFSEKLQNYMRKLIYKGHNEF
jgi:hypothetical protein